MPWAIVLAFVVVGVLRLNPFCLFEPDSPDYLFTARSLASLEGYREIDDPDNPPHAFRPPGLPLLLAPLAVVRPYDAVSAKVVVLACSALVLWLVFGWTHRLTESTWAAAVVALLVASSPYTLLHATEVVTEGPFLALLFGVLGFVSREDAPSPRRQAAVGLLLSLLPLMRTIGFALIGAVLVWSLFDRKRRVWWIPTAVALGVNILWLLRNASTGVITYFAGMRHDFEEKGVGGYLAQAWEQTGYYVSRLGEVLLPGTQGGPPVYERVVIGDAPLLGGPAFLPWLLAVVVIALALYGLYALRRGSGALVLLYLLAFGALLAIYPPRHERLAWPLVPLIWVFAAVGIKKLVDHQRILQGASVVAALLILWQAGSSLTMVSTNLAWMRGGDRFYEERVPPVYYADWQAAGRWLNENAPPWARVLTRHSDVGFTSRRLQDSVRFEEIGPRSFAGAVDALYARYVVMPATLFDWLAPHHLVFESPAFRLDEVWRERDVVVYEVVPNRTGTVTGEDPRLDEKIEACRAAHEREPERVDLVRRLAELLQEMDRDDEALQLLDDFTEANGANARVLKTKGSILLALERFEEAAAAFEAGQSAPDRRSVERTLARGLERAREGAPGDPVERARGFLQAGLYRSAARELGGLSHVELNDSRILGLNAALLERLGQMESAESLLRELADAGSRPAQAGLERIELERRLLAGDPELPEEAYGRLATTFVAAGLRGKALALMEKAVERFPTSVRARRELGFVYLLNGRPELAEPLLAAAVSAEPGEARSRELLASCRELLAVRGY